MSINNEITDTELYRDSIATVDESGKRRWIFPKKPKGRFYEYRKWVSYVLLVLLFGLPFVKMNGEPFILLNVLERHFILFGVSFAPQDFYLFALAMVTGMLFIVLFTVVFGRLFCGWVCPQTIFMEMVFRRIEYWIEGDFGAQKRLNRAPWTAEKIRKKGSKHLLFILVSAVIAHTFLSYIIGVEAVWQSISSPPLENFSGFAGMVVFTAVFYAVFAYMREQVCIAVCPYGRLQGVLVDKNSIAIIYDWVRGEPRGKLKKPGHKQRSREEKEDCKKTCTNCRAGNSCADDILTKIEVEIKKAADTAVSTSKITEGLQLPESPAEQLDVPQGDCIDCGLCVKVCPTGIDIRNGTQLECVNCTACIDACDEVMLKTGKKPGLIRYDSYAGVKKNERKIFTPRVIAYSVLLVSLVLLNAVLLYNRSEVDFLLLRTPGMLYQKNDDGTISNLYNYQILNKSGKDIQPELKLKNLPEGKIRIVGELTNAPAGEQTKGILFIDLPESELKARNKEVIMEVWSDGKKIETIKTNFLGSGKKK